MPQIQGSLQASTGRRSFYQDAYASLVLHSSECSLKESASGVDIGAISNVSRGALARAASRASAATRRADAVASSAEAPELGGSNTSDGLALERVTEGDGRGDGLARELLSGVVDDHAALAVASEDDLGLGALAQPRVGLVGHGDTARTGAGCLGHNSGHVSCVRCALEDRVGDVGRDGLLKTGADNASEGAHLGGTAGEEDGEGLAARGLADLNGAGGRESGEEYGGDGGGLHFERVDLVVCGGF